MRPYPMIALLLCSASLPVFSQRAADWSVEMPGSAQKIVLQTFTGIPVVQTDKAYVGIDPETQKEAWSIKRGGNKLLAAMTAEETDLCAMRNTPYFIIRDNVVDSRTGQAILDEERDGYKEMGEYAVLPDLNGVLVQVVAKNMVRLCFVSMAENKLKWIVDVTKVPMFEGVDLSPEGKKAADDAERDAAKRMLEMQADATFLTPDGYLLFRYKKTLACIKTDTGKLLWAEKADAAELLLSPDGKAVIVAEAETGPVPDGVLSRPKGRRVAAYSLVSGKPVWKKDIKADAQIRWMDAQPKYLTVVHRKGCNLYSYNTGEPLWENDFSGKRVIEVLPNDEGYHITFESGSKTMQLAKDGTPRWKKPFLVEVEDGAEPEDDTPDDSGVDRFNYAKGTVLVSADKIRFVPAKGSGMKRWKMKLGARDRISFDPARNNLLVITLEKLLLVNPDQNPKAALEVKVDIKDPYAFHSMEIREKIYFLSSEKECVVLDPAAGTATHHYYPKPFDPTAVLYRTIDAGFNSINRTYNSSLYYSPKYGTYRPGYCNREIRQNAAAYRDVKREIAGSNLIPPARFSAFKQSLDYAYYLTDEAVGNKGKNVLVKVGKDKGDELDKLVLDNARPIYQVDEVQGRLFYAHKNTLKVFKM